MRKIIGTIVAVALAATGLFLGSSKVAAAGAYSISINDVSSPEGGPGSFADFIVSITPRPSGASLLVDFATANGVATSTATCPSVTSGANDYIAVNRSGTQAVSFTPNNTTSSVRVLVCGDTVDEPDETFTANLSNARVNTCPVAPCSVSISDGVGVGTILDNDGPSTPPPPGPSGIVVNIESSPRGTVARDCVYPVRLNAPAPAGTTITVGWSTPGTYRVDPQQGIVSFSPGEASKTIVVDIVKLPYRRPRTLIVELTSVTNGATIGERSGSCQLSSPPRNRR